jgi:hypothetical protein
MESQKGTSSGFGNTQTDAGAALVPPQCCYNGASEDFMKKVPWSSILLAVSALSAIFASPVQAIFASHPAVVSTIYTVWGIFNHFLPSPSAPPASK